MQKVFLSLILFSGLLFLSCQRTLEAPDDWFHPDIPTVSASDGEYEGAVALKWNAVEGAAYYFVYKSTSPGGTYSHVPIYETLSSSTTTNTTLQNSAFDRSVSSGVIYYYKVGVVLKNGRFTTITQTPFDAGCTRNDSSAELSGLLVSSGQLSPAFSPLNQNYSLALASSAASLTLTPTAAQPGAVIRLNGNPVISGKSRTLSVSYGASSITLEVTAPDTVTTRTYTLNLTRGMNARLKSLSLSAGSLSPVFSAETLAYTLTIWESFSSVQVTAVLEDPAASLTLQGSPAPSGSASDPISTGVASIVVKVTAADGVTTQTYTLTLNKQGLVFTTGGNAGWSEQTSTYYSPPKAWKSGFIADNQSTYLSTTVTGPGTLTFYWRTNSEDGYDLLTFHLDEVYQFEISGLTDWQLKSVPIPTGSHTLKWKYSKDHMISIGADAGYVDEIVFTPQ